VPNQRNVPRLLGIGWPQAGTNLYRCSPPAAPRLHILRATIASPRKLRRLSLSPNDVCLSPIGVVLVPREPSYAGGAAIAAAGARLRLDRRLTSMMRRPCAAQKPGDGTNGDDHKESGHTGVRCETYQDLDRDTHQEREDRAEHGSDGDREYGPGWETTHADTNG